MDLINKRRILQPILDSIELGWVIIKPPMVDPCDPEDLCVFHEPVNNRHAEVSIPNDMYGNLERKSLESLLQTALQHPQVRKP